VGERDQPRRARSSGQAALEVGHVELAEGVVVDHFDHRAASSGHLQHGHGVGGVLGVRREDPIARFEGKGVEGHVERTRGVLDEGDLGGGAAEEPAERVVVWASASFASSAAS